MLVRDSEALAQFCVDHRIPNDVVIERPSPNDNADWVEGEGNRMPIRTWFIYQARLRFPLSKLLRTVLSLCGHTFIQISVNFVRTVLAVEALIQREELEFTAEDLLHVYCVVKPRKNSETQMLEDKDQYLNDFIWVSGQWEFPAGEPDLFSVPRHRGYVSVGFNRRFWRRSDRCLAAISAMNNCGRSRKVSDLLDYVSLYRYTIPLRATRQGHPVLPPLQIPSPGSRPRSSLFDEVSDLFEGTSAELRRLLEEAEGKSFGSNESSSSSWDVDLGDEGLDEEAEVEDDEEVDQVPTAENEEIMAPKVRTLEKGQAPIIEPPMLPEAPNSSIPVPTEDQSIAPSSMVGGKHKGKQPTEGTSRQKREKGTWSAIGTPELWAPQFTTVELGKQVTSTDTFKDHETCVVLGNAVMLPQDVANHAAEITVEFGGKLVMLGAQRVVSSSLRLKQGAVDLKKANQKANSLEKELKQTKSELTNARLAAEIVILQRNQAQQEVFDLKAFACSEVYKKLFDLPSSELEMYTKGNSPSSTPAFFRKDGLPV
ncbi:hypothetical protein Acr_14g0008720 [Actinidia rufa]|uniref:Uncharacterized protein n=1 Tax=Actinidia rufa TaxID=165716 RepID=A0A7J0FS37_9ERIC|nr:hypothetical protein Acr_14g0008720 [Actinidia rufa]